MTTEITIQEIFDAVEERFRDGKGRAYDPVNEQCMYRTPDGNRCAVGCLLTDDEYDPSIEGLGVRDLLDIPRLEPHAEALYQLQRMHDAVLANTRHNWDGNVFVNWPAFERLKAEFVGGEA